MAAANTLDSVGTWKPQALALVDSGIVPLMVMDVDYHRLIRDSTIFFNAFNLINDQLYDVAGRTETPFGADSISPYYAYRDPDYTIYESLVQGYLVFTRFEPRTDEKLGTVEGTFEFTVTNEAQDSTFYITDGEFRYRVQHSW